MSMVTFPIRSAARPRLALTALVVALGLLLAACGGDNGGNGGNGGGFEFKVAIVNQSDADIEVSLDGDTPGEPVTVPTCDVLVHTFVMPDTDWTLMVGGQAAIESINLESNLMDRPLTAQVRLKADDTIILDNLTAGSFIQTPSKAGICN